MITVVIPLHHGGGKLGNDSELRFALRSIAENFREESYQVVVIGRRLPRWVDGVTFIAQRSKGLKTALIMASDAFPSGFFWYYDDCCLLRGITAEEMKVTPCSRGWARPLTSWAKNLDEVRAKLEAAKIKPWDYSRPHGPYWFDKAMIDEALKDLPGVEGKFPFESWILSKRDWPRRHSGYKQYYGAFKGPPGEQQQFLNYNNAGFTDELQAWLVERFPGPCRFEREIPAVAPGSRVSGVVITLPGRPRWEEQCVREMSTIGVDLELFVGHDGHKGEAPPMRVHTSAFKKEFKRLPLAGEIGCFASHLNFARQAENLPPFHPEMPEWRLMFEDDAIPLDIDATKLIEIAVMAETEGYDLVMLHTGRDNRRGKGGTRLSKTSGNDIFTHAYLANLHACREMSGWMMRHPIDLAISKAKQMNVAVLWGQARFDQRHPLTSSVSIHRERNGLQNQLLTAMTIETAFEGISNPDHRRGCNKLARHGYGPMYQSILDPLRGTEASLVEIGVATGASLLGFRRFLGPEAKLTGLDVDLSLLRFTGEPVHQMDARTPAAAALFPDESLDVVIDDGSHKLEDQWAAFQVMWPKVKEGGCYVIEDICDGFSLAVKFSDYRIQWFDTRDQAEKHPWSLCAVLRKGSPADNHPELAAYTLRYGDQDWMGECARSLEGWTARHGVELKVWGEPAAGLYPTAKFSVVEMLKDFVENSPADYMLYIDADVFIHPDAPKFPTCPGLLAMTDRPHQNWGGHWQKWCEKHFGETPRGFSYRNAGLWCCDKEAARRLLQVAVPPFIEEVQDQHQFNWWVYRALKAGMHLQSLHPTWNRDSSVGKPAWMFHLWGGRKMEKLQALSNRGLLTSSDPAGKLVVADCGWQRKRGLGNRLTLLCDAYASAKIRGMQFAYTWSNTKHCRAQWGELFQPLPGIELVSHIPRAAERRRSHCYYTGDHMKNCPEFWEAWKEMARMIQLADGLELPDHEPFDAVSLRLTHPRGAYHNRQIAKMPRLKNAFISSDCLQGIAWVKEVLPDAWDLSPKLFNADDVQRDLEHMQAAARDMMMLTRARSIFALGRESTFRNLAVIGYGVPVYRQYEGLAP